MYKTSESLQKDFMNSVINMAKAIGINCEVTTDAGTEKYEVDNSEFKDEDENVSHDKNCLLELQDIERNNRHMIISDEAEEIKINHNTEKFGPIAWYCKLSRNEISLDLYANILAISLSNNNLMLYSSLIFDRIFKTCKIKISSGKFSNDEKELKFDIGTKIIDAVNMFDKSFDEELLNGFKLAIINVCKGYFWRE